MTLTEFLLARLAEDMEDVCHCCDDGLDTIMGFARADLEAKRRIATDFVEIEQSKVDALAAGHVWAGDMWLSATCRAIQHLASAYADHVDFREEWRL